MNNIDLCEMIEQYGNSLYSFCFRLTGNRPDADDLYQETFLKALELRSRTDHIEHPRAYLAAVATNLWKNNRRKYTRRQQIAPTHSWTEELEQTVCADEKGSPENIAVERERIAAVRVAVQQLDEKYRLPLYMFYTAEMSLEDIAAALKLPLGTVKSRLNRAKKSLRKYLEVIPYEEY